jgi:hypothetical protein
MLLRVNAGDRRRQRPSDPAEKRLSEKRLFRSGSRPTWLDGVLKETTAEGRAIQGFNSGFEWTQLRFKHSVPASS